MLYCAKTKPESKFSKNSLARLHCSVCFAIQGAMRGTVQKVANALVTSKSVKAQWFVIIGVRICLAWSGGVICCHRKELEAVRHRGSARS